MRGDKVARKAHKMKSFKIYARGGERKIKTLVTPEVIARENAIKQICLNCTKPKCNGFCEVFRS